MGDLHKYKIGNIEIESSISKEEAEEFAKTKFRDTAKDFSVKAVKEAKVAGKAASEAFNKAVEDAKKAIEEAKPVVEENVDKAVKEVKAFVEEVKEEVSKEE